MKPIQLKIVDSQLCTGPKHCPVSYYDEANDVVVEYSPIPIIIQPGEAAGVNIITYPVAVIGPLGLLVDTKTVMQWGRALAQEVLPPGWIADSTTIKLAVIAEPIQINAETDVAIYCVTMQVPVMDDDVSDAAPASSAVN